MSEFSMSDYEDRIRKEKVLDEKKNIYSKYCDFVYYPSSRNPELMLAMKVSKPAKPSYILAGTHGWHMSVGDFIPLEDEPESEYLKLRIDMRGRAYSDGAPDCNGWELYDVIDAVEYAKKHYSQYIIDPEIVYYEAGSGGGANGLALAGKFPDYFTQITARSGTSDYFLWYENDSVGEFRDEMDIWIGDIRNREAYDARSGITLVKNLCTPLTIVHSELDERVPVYHARNYVKAAKNCGKGHLVSYMEMKGVGGQAHFEHITPEQKAEMEAFCRDNRNKHKIPPQIPRQGTMVVGGYLFTKAFSVVLQDIGKVAEITYDLDAGKLEVIGLDENQYTKELYEKSSVNITKAGNKTRT